MKRVGLALGFAAALIAVMTMAATQQRSDGSEEPRYTSDNRLLRPANYGEWIWLSSSLGMSYTPGPPDGDPSFANVFVNPSAYRAFVSSGKWPDKTVLVLEVRSSVSKTSINQKGRVQGAVTGVEVHVKDERRFPGKWAFFDFENSAQSGSLFPRSADCYSCHEQHGAVDTTFVQFYPTLMDVAKQKGTVQPRY
jgi:hypothetical protein